MLAIDGLSEADIDAGVALSSLAGWNQCASDWALLLRSGTGFGVRARFGGSAGERLVASAVALPYPPDFGWVSMVLVHPDWRRQGLATRLLGQAIAHLTERGLTPMLDATPAGAKVYRPLGFLDIEPISRWRGTGKGDDFDAPAETIDLARAGPADLTAFGADRGGILADFANRPHAVARTKRDGVLLLSRAGRTATQIGPLIARRQSDAVDVLDQAIAVIDGPILIDVPDRNSTVADLLGRRGFTVERPFIRMALGRRSAFGSADHIRATAGPEFG